MARTLAIVRESPLEYKLARTLLSLTDIGPEKALISLPLYLIPSAAIEQDNRGLIRLDDILLILESLMLIS